MELARALWLRVETIHAVTYFGEPTIEAGRAAGLTGFWMGYFGFRAAPLGTVGSGAVEATFFNFAPSFVRRWVPDVWQHASPGALVTARSTAAAASLREVAPGIDGVASRVNPLLAVAVARASAAGRSLFASNRLVALPDDPVAAMWQLCTCLREHRGDGHVAALTASGLDGCEAHVLISLEQGNSPHDLQKARGWTADDWSDATSRCIERGLVDGTGGLTAEGRALRASIEATTDRLAAVPLDALGADERTTLLAALAPVASAISASGVIRYPNPMGLPAFRG